MHRLCPNPNPALLPQQEILDKAGATLAAAQHVPLHARLLGSRPAAGVPPGTRKQVATYASQALTSASGLRPGPLALV